MYLKILQLTFWYSNAYAWFLSPSRKELGTQDRHLNKNGLNNDLTKNTIKKTLWFGVILFNCNLLLLQSLSGTGSIYLYKHLMFTRENVWAICLKLTLDMHQITLWIKKTYLSLQIINFGSRILNSPLIFWPLFNECCQGMIRTACIRHIVMQTQRRSWTKIETVWHSNSTWALFKI